ncbi:MAG: sigma-70 family RNA polymerase sigma factor, partial [Pseudomonadota bacterium]
MNNIRHDIVDHLSDLRGYAMSLTRDRDRADDLVQDTVVKAWANISKFETGTNLRAWLFTILRNTHYSNARKVRREVRDPDGYYSASLVEKPAHDGRLTMRDFGEAFAQLSQDQQMAITLVGAAGYSYEQAAQACGCEVGTIKSRVARGRAQLQKIMHLAPSESL